MYIILYLCLEKKAPQDPISLILVLQSWKPYRKNLNEIFPLAKSKRLNREMKFIELARPIVKVLFDHRWLGYIN